MATRDSKPSEETLWYQDAVVYQLHVRAFFDSDDDGIGDFAGLTRKLDYLQDLGVTALWLLPFYPSPLRDDGYDIADYTGIHPSYGDLHAVKAFLNEAHARGLRVITELVLNHTSDQHPWFRRARLAPPGSAARNFYVWNDTPEKYTDARIIFKDFETSNWSWDPQAKAYYWHRFYAHQPDLNFDNPQVVRAMLQTVDYWLRLGVDGLRLDAVPYLFEREGTNCENLPETHSFLKQLRRHVDATFSGRMLLAEANQWPEDAIAYFGQGDECHAAFHFPIMPRLFMAIQLEDRFPVLDILQETPAIPDGCQWFIFLRNHDELTLEMVTDEERDYMYRVYARDRQARINLGIRRRLAPLLENNRPKIELMNGLLCSLPGTPVIYYGDEIGMGDNIYLGDRNGVRTPMQWSTDRNAGFSNANPQRLYSPLIMDSEYLYETVNVETQQKNPHSLLWWMKRLIGVRQRHPALSRGKLEWLTPENAKVIAFTRELDDETVLVVANLSRFPQFAELDLTRFAGRQVVELFGQHEFPVASKAPYLVTLAGHGFYWFALQKVAVATAGAEQGPPRIRARGDWQEILSGRPKQNFETIVARWLPRQSWYLSRGKTIRYVHVAEQIPLAASASTESLVLLGLRVDFIDGEPENYLLPLATAWGAKAEQIQSATPAGVLAHLDVTSSGLSGVVFDATVEPTAIAELLKLVSSPRRIKGQFGTLRGVIDGQEVRGIADAPVTTALGSRSRDGSSTFLFGDKLRLKIFRRLEAGPHPEVELGRYLMNGAVRFSHTLPVLGTIEYRRPHDESTIVGVLHRYVPHTTTGTQFMRDSLGRLLEHVMTQPPATLPDTPPTCPCGLWELAEQTVPPPVPELLSSQLDWSALLGRITGELHMALASNHDQPAITREPVTQLYQRSLYQWWRKLALQSLERLQRDSTRLPADAKAAADALLGQEKTMLDAFRDVVGQRITADRIRCHGQFDLSHVLNAGTDILIVDFDGDAQRPLSARGIKACVLTDLASMIHSYHAAAANALATLATSSPSAEAVAICHRTLALWRVWMGSAFLRAYRTTIAGTGLLPRERSQLDPLWRAYLLESTLIDVRSSLANHPERVAIPLAAALDVLGIPS